MKRWTDEPDLDTFRTTSTASGGHYTLTDAGRRAIARDDQGRLDVRRYLELLDGTVA